MIDAAVNTIEEFDLSREERVIEIQNLIETLRIAEEIAEKGYLITSSELADLMDINASAVTSRGDHWSWRSGQTTLRSTIPRAPAGTFPAFYGWPSPCAGFRRRRNARYCQK